MTLEQLAVWLDDNAGTYNADDPKMLRAAAAACRALFASCCSDYSPPAFNRAMLDVRAALAECSALEKSRVSGIPEI